jgi:hypothetical protein
MSNLEEVDVAKKSDFKKPQKNDILRPKYFYDRPSWVNLTRWESIETDHGESKSSGIWLFA